MPTLTRSLEQLILKSNPYSGFSYQNYTQDLQGWGSHDPIFSQVIQAIAPSLILEVGSWKGTSAIHMVDLLKKYHPSPDQNFTIVCIDTWLGAIEHIDDSIEFGIEKYRQHGYPHLYDQFLANVMYANHQDWIVPFPNTSLIAARFLRKQQIQADLIYIDASHEEEDVYADVTNYWQLLRSGGIMFGDDWDAGALGYGVICAVNRFVKEKGLNLQVQGNKWLVQK
jgi:hypothetical protein